MEYMKPCLACVIPHIGGWYGAWLTRKHKAWYATRVKKPWWKPKPWIFMPLWKTLYTCMGYASYLVWRDGGGFGGQCDMHLVLFATQLTLNWAWTPIFFEYRRVDHAAIEITFLTGAVAGCVIGFHGINKMASYLMMPYLAWCIYASALNYWIAIYNKKEDYCKFKEF